MKKILSFLLGIVLLSACCGTTENNNSGVDSTLVDSTLVDSLDTTIVDSVKSLNC